jgi:CheY-like chemotaxis protein/anti-sigma regulatory factor (Ser/Thr protein kinase)
MAKARGLALTIGAAPGLAAVRPLIGDSGRLRQILLNLGVNAIKFTERGSVQIDIKAEAVARDRAHLLFTVRDTGVGIALEDQARVFETFVQADSSYTRGQSGAGLGLAICRQIAEKMGGGIRLESVPGRGSVFYLELPVALGVEADRPSPEDSAASAPAAVSALQTGESTTQSARILVAEDNPDNRLLLSAYLKAAQYDLQFVENGQEAVDALDLVASAGRAFDLVLMDIQMPVLDGLSAVREIRRRETAFFRERTPIVAVTAHAFEEEAARCFDAGCDGYLSKPIRRDELLAVIADHARRSAPRSG